MTTFYLKVRLFNQTCVFELSWGQGQQLSATLTYPESLTAFYQEWQRVYLSYYKSGLRGWIEASGSVTTPPIDWHAKLVQTEAKLLSEFHHWLRSAELFEIRATIAKSQGIGGGLMAKEAVSSVTPQFQTRRYRSQELGAGSQGSTVNVFLTCDSIELERLPWEAWEIGAEFPMFGTIRLARTPVEIRQETVPSRRKKARILVIWGDDTGLNFQGDKQAMRSLSRIAEIEFVAWQPGVDIAEFKDKVSAAIADERGWDVLFFAGHSHETTMTGGELAIAPNASMSICEIIPQLSLAKQRGLQFALFNSCSGLSLASSLINLGLSQVAVMREPIHNAVAQVFLFKFLQGLAEYKDVYDSLLAACQHLKVEKNLTYPSAYLIPSLFCHPDAVLFRIKPSGIKETLKRILPTPKEAIALSALTLLSLSLPVQDFLLEQRVFTQAVYRQVTRQVPAAAPPPVLLVQIDEKSIQEAKIADPKPMDRKYLASLVDKLSALNARVIGIDYLLDRPQGEKDRILARSLQSSVIRQPHPTWFVLASVRDDTAGWLTALPEIATPNWSLQGSINLNHGYVGLVPEGDEATQKLPFAYLVALAYELNREVKTSTSESPQPPLLRGEPQKLPQVLPPQPPLLRGEPQKLPQSFTPFFKATVYTHLVNSPHDAALRPPSPPILGGTGVQSPPELGDLGGEKDLCVHGSLFKGGKGGSNGINPQLNSQTDFFSQLTRYLHQEKRLDYRSVFSPLAQLQPITNFSYEWGQMWLHPIIDFSIPPKQVYQRIPAWQLLESKANSPQFSHLQQQVVMIAAGGYGEAGVFQEGQDNFPLPAAVSYWFQQANPPVPCRRFTGGESHAYMIHHYLNRRLVVPIPDLWLIGVAVLLGKSMALAMKPRQQRIRWRMLLGGTAVYGLVSLQLYIWGALLLPWIFPSVTFWTYALPGLLRKKSDASRGIGSRES
ncbi:CHASE2 domain-containing protein [Allocoleopsis sp.]|uniref:CHASE2 domain-containing protein n=1 Tax=Allocoleopsis sp. TaxID=3088169 RepID=UPI002FD14BAA